MTMHELINMIKNNGPIWYINNDGEEFEAQVESIDNEGYVIINIANENRLRVSLEELRG